MSQTYSTSFGDITLTVKPQQMYAAASGIETKVKASQQSFDKMLSMVKNTTSYWEGETSDGERKLFEKENENFQSLIQNLNNYATELRVITGIYETSEETIAESSQSLVAGILS